MKIYHSVSSKGFIVLGLTCRSMIHFQFTFTYGVRVSNFILCMWLSTCHGTMCCAIDYAFPPLSGLDILVKNQLTVDSHLDLFLDSQFYFTQTYRLYMPLYFFSLPSCPGQNLRHMLKGSGKSRCTCLVPDLVGKHPVFHYKV